MSSPILSPKPSIINPAVIKAPPLSRGKTSELKIRILKSRFRFDKSEPEVDGIANPIWNLTGTKTTKREK